MVEQTFFLLQVKGNVINVYVRVASRVPKRLKTVKLKKGKVTSVFNFIPSNIWSLPQGVSKVVLHTDLNVQRQSSGDSWFVINNLLGCFKWSQTRSISCTSLIFPVTFIKVCTQYTLHCTVDGLN